MLGVAGRLGGSEVDIYEASVRGVGCRGDGGREGRSGAGKWEQINVSCGGNVLEYIRK